MRTALLFFVMFPFVKILPLETYNQPYALLCATAIFALIPRVVGSLPGIDRMFLVYLAVIGGILFVLSLNFEVGLREVLYLLAYVSPLVMVSAVYHVIRFDHARVRRALTLGVMVWIGVGLIQSFVDVGFLSFLVSHSDNLAQDIARSGRGVLSLAPEPTHHGFQMICLAAAIVLLRGPTWVALLAVGDALLLAMSTSALVAVAAGLVVWCFLRPWRLIYLGMGLMVTALVGGAIVVMFIDPSTRIGRLIDLTLQSGGLALLSDTSANLRFFGIVAPIREAFADFLMPIGLSHDAWLEMRNRVLTSESVIADLSEYGPASGYGALLVQGGIFTLPVLIYFFWRICMSNAATWRGILPCCAFFVFLGQIYVSTPVFAIVLACSMFASEYLTRESAERSFRTPGGALPNIGTG